MAILNAVVEWERLGYTGDPAKLQIGTRVADPIESTLQANVKWASNNQGSIGFVKWIVKEWPHGEWDYKNDPDWNEVSYNWNGLTLNAEDLGNLNFGLTGAALGLSEEFVMLGNTGANALFGEIKSPIDGPGLGDSLQDVFYIHLGYEYYDVLMGDSTFGYAFAEAYYDVY